MRSKWFAVGCLAALGVLAWSVPSHAGDTVRLNLVDSTPTRTLVGDSGGADTILAHYGGFGGGFYHGGFGGGFHHGFGGFNRGFGYNRGFYSPFYGFNRGFYRPYYGYGLGLGGYGLGYGGYGLGYGGYGLGYGGYGLGYGGYGLGYGGYGMGYGGYGMGYGGYYGPCSGGASSVYILAMPATNAYAPLSGSPQPRYTDLRPSQPPREDGTYPYDGGPNNSNSNPKTAPAPSNAPQRTVPLEGRSVSLPKPATKWAYPAYGETFHRTSFGEERTLLTKNANRR